ncbi:MAG: tetratricopeptide repeat protein [Bacteroidota bacterium]
MAKRNPKSKKQQQVKKSHVSNSQPTDWKRIGQIAAMAIVIGLVTFFFYNNVSDFNLVYCDDNIFVMDYQQYNQDMDNVWKSFDKTIGTSYYRPILAISFIIDNQLGGIDPSIYHKTNLMIHVLGSMLVFFFLLRLGYTEIKSFFFGVIFALHPILTPAASWISGRNDSLITIFVLLSFICLVSLYKYQKDRYEGKDYLIIVLLYLLQNFFFFMALFTKEIGGVLPVVGIAYVLLWRKEKMITMRNFMVGLGWTIIVIIWYFMRNAALTGIDNPDTIGFDAFIKNYPTIPAMIGKMFLPVKMIALSNFEMFSIVSGIIFMIILAALLIWLKPVEKNRALFGILWFLIFFFPTLFVRIVYVDDFFDYAEHRAYLSMIGIMIVVIEILRGLKVDFRKPIPIVVMLLIIAALGYRSYIYKPHFEDRTTFWTHHVEMYPEKSRGYLDLGKAYFVEGKLGQADSLYQLGVVRNPNNKNLYVDLSALKLQEGKVDTALVYARKALKIDPTDPIANHNMGKALVLKQNFKKSIPYLEKAAHNTKFFHWVFMLGVAYYHTQQPEKAIQAYRRTLQLNPKFAPAYSNIGGSLAMMGKMDKAVEAWEQAIRIQPNLPDPYNNLIAWNIQQKNLKKARQYLMKAREHNIQLRPNIEQQVRAAGIG